MGSCKVALLIETVDGGGSLCYRGEFAPPKYYPSLIVPDNRGYYVLIGYPL